MAIDLSRPHHTNPTAAKDVIEDFARQLASELGARYAWEGDRLVFSRTGVRGHLQVDAENVYLHIDKSRFVPLSDQFLKDQAQFLMEEHFPEPSAQPATTPATEAQSSNVADEEAIEEPLSSDPIEANSSDTSSEQDGLLGAAGTLTASLLDFAQQAGQAAWKAGASLTGNNGENPMEATGQRLKILRIQAGLSLEEVRKMLGLPDDLLLQDVEQGRSPLPLHLVHKLIDLLQPPNPGTLLNILKKVYAPQENTSSTSSSDSDSSGT